MQLSEGRTQDRRWITSSKVIDLDFKLELEMSRRPDGRRRPVSVRSGMLRVFQNIPASGGGVVFAAENEPAKIGRARAHFAAAGRARSFGRALAGESAA